MTAAAEIFQGSDYFFVTKHEANYLFVKNNWLCRVLSKSYLVDDEITGLHGIFLRPISSLLVIVNVHI